jgi:hypothetical protein
MSRVVLLAVALTLGSPAARADAAEDTPCD